MTQTNTSAIKYLLWFIVFCIACAVIGWLLWPKPTNDPTSTPITSFPDDYTPTSAGLEE